MTQITGTTARRPLLLTILGFASTALAIATGAIPLA
jgi:hypothetical protein